MKKMKALPGGAGPLFGGALCLAAILLPACRKADAPEAKRDGFALTDRTRRAVVLEVGGTPLTNEDFSAYVRSAVGDKGSGLEPAALSRLFDDFADEKTFLVRARGAGTVLADEERTAQLDKWRKAAPAEGPGVPPESGTDILLERALVEKYLAGLTRDIRVEDREIAEYYAARKGDFLQPEKVQVSQILLDSEGKASAIRDRLRGATEDDFRAVARRESAGPEAAKGGIMGVFSPGQLPQELESFILPLGAGEISRVVGSSYGFHIFRLDKRIESRLVPLADASAAIGARLFDEKGRLAVAAHLEELRRAPDWRAFPERLPFAYQRNENP